MNDMNKCKCLAVAVALAGCTSVYDATVPRQMARLTSGTDERVGIVLPTFVQRGTRFDVNIRSYYCPGYEQAPTTVTLNRLAVTITPYIQSVDHRMYDCTIIEDSTIHTVGLRFYEAGQARVTVVGIASGGDTLRIDRYVNPDPAIVRPRPVRADRSLRAGEAER
jgi:hypothetical protein